VGKLVLFRSDGTAQDIKLDRDRVTIGRRPDNDVCLPQAVVSGEHAAVVTILDDSFLEDLGSTNGTLVNGKAVGKHFLQDRDQIDIGREILVYLVDESANVDAPPPRSERAPTPESGEGAPSGDTNRPTGQQDKRRSDVPAISGQSVDALQREVAAEIESSATNPQQEATTGSAGESPLRGLSAPPPARPAIRVRSGPAAGNVVVLATDETVIGRPGVQVVALRRLADDILVVPIEGAIPPSINGMPIPPDGQRLAAGDILEIAGATLELVTSSDALA
jgi:predicted component of type VI protein secretion system